jgi:hypothetical protein
MLQGLFTRTVVFVPCSIPDAAQNQCSGKETLFSDSGSGSPLQSLLAEEVALEQIPDELLLLDVAVALRHLHLEVEGSISKCDEKDLADYLKFAVFITQNTAKKDFAWNKGTKH